ncbi:MAG: methyltransferase domain-containing protein [Acidobacteria bacterium]|jgi:ribosomal protein L11 methyltransferase|nr:MAG: methyltransferase domain-containing protein [Acidobacteriota bacterium]
MPLYKKYVYKLSSEEFYGLLVDITSGVEVLSEGESYVEFALYEPIQGLEPLEVLEVEVIPPERAFKPVRVKSLLVVPNWIKPIVIRQGSAFGTGLHPTTQLCLDLIQDFFQEGWSAVDVGTGTGVLAMALKKLGAGRVVAIDKDPVAVEECRHNTKENCLEVECLLAGPEEVTDSFDLLVANLDLGIFRKEIENLLKLFRRVGVFSGIYGKDELESFLSLLRGLKPAKIKRRKNWYGVVVLG